MDKEDLAYIYICIHTMEHYSTIKKNEIVPFATIWMDLESIKLSEMSDRERQIHVFTHMWNLRYKTNEFI